LRALAIRPGVDLPRPPQGAPAIGGAIACGRSSPQLDTSFQMIRNARRFGIPILSGSDTGNASAFARGK
jgi:hypothetical protein